ncbi:MAG: hypothetical protein FP812_04345 [Desulfobacula sp.]|nr:hypothetical protein [Desulfobacula sp.]
MPVMIAPFWADVETYSPGSPTPGGNSTGSNLVYYDLDATNHKFTATWDDVGYFSNHTDRLNAFQLQLVDRGNGDFDIVFRYEDINWVTGDIPGIARAGVTAWDGINYLEIDPSGNADDMMGLGGERGTSCPLGYWEINVRGGKVDASVAHDGYDDVLIGGDSDDVFHGRLGNDTLIGNDGNDTLFGESGKDKLWGGQGNDYLAGGSGNDELFGSLGSDYLDGGDGWDEVSYKNFGGSQGISFDWGSGFVGYSGSDAFVDTVINIEGFEGSEYADTLVGDESDNFFEASYGNDSYDGGGSDGCDHVSYDDLDDPSFINVKIDFSGSDNIVTGYGYQDSLVGILFEDTLTDIDAVTGSMYGDTIIGGTGNGYFFGAGGNDTMSGGTQEDTLYGGDGDDSLHGDCQNDVLHGDAGNDSLYGDYQNDTLYGGDGDDFLYGGKQDDVLYGGNGDDFLSGGENDDFLFGGAGRDTLDGGAGTDIFCFSDAGSADLVSEFDASEDVIKFYEGDLGFSAKNANGYHFFGHSSDGYPDELDPTAFKIIGINDLQADGSWSDASVASAINGAIDASLGDGSNDGTYFILNNGTTYTDGNARVYFWEGDTNESGTVDVTGDASNELHLLADLTGISLEDIVNMTDQNFQIHSEGF